jgi:hypothetical protein
VPVGCIVVMLGVAALHAFGRLHLLDVVCGTDCGMTWNTALLLSSGGFSGASGSSSPGLRRSTAQSLGAVHGATVHEPKVLTFVATTRFIAIVICMILMRYEW